MANHENRRIGCAEFRRHLRLDRRSFLRAGMLGAAGLSLADLLRLEGRAAGVESTRRNSVIILWMRGGPSHMDTWDPKPDAPDKFRGEFGVQRTSVPDIILSDMLPLSARIMNKWSIIRDLHHEHAGHSTADQICFTGYRHPSRNGNDHNDNAYPSCGSIVSRQLGHLSPHLPAYVMIPRMVPGTGPAYLGVAHKPFETMPADPANPGPFRLPNFALPQAVTLERLGERRQLLASFDQLRRDIDARGQMEAQDRYQHQAWDVLTATAARDAFDLDKEPAPVRERYGFLPAFRPPESNRCGAPAWSQRILLARRLVEAGVRLVTVDCRWWDTHVKGFESLRQGFLPRWDRAYSALIEDLDQRGLLATTLVIAWGEFGRTPEVNNDAGRDHYPNVFSAALAGGPIHGGRVVGASDARGAYPRSPHPKIVEDVLATMYRHLGVDTKHEYLTHTGRPVPVLPCGTPIEELC